MKNHIVFISEKRDAAYAIANALSLHIKEHDGYLEDSSKQYYYTWAQGHLLTLKDPGEMNDEWKDWKWDNLPIIPSALSLKPLPNASEKLNIISNLTKNCRLIVNCCDPAFEGELVYIFIRTYLGLTNIPTKRLWTASLQQTAIKEAFANMKDNSEYKYLQNMAICRALGDWIIGINTSRGITLLGNNQQSFSIGRVILACLGLLYDREIERESFKPETYYKLKGLFGQGERKIEARYIGPRISEIDQAKEIIQSLVNQVGTLEWIDKKKIKEPPKLFNLTDVCVIANQRFNISPSKTSKILESLYLKKLITYPRTSARVVTPNEYIHMRAAYRLLSVVYPNLHKAGGDIDRLKQNDPRIFDKHMQFDHHAIIPEVAVPTNFDSNEEKAIYHLIVERFLLQFCENHEYINRKVTLTFESAKFEASYKQVMVPGWKDIDLNFAIEPDEVSEDEDQVDVVEVTELPPFEHEGPVQLLEAKIEDKETNPPPLYTEGTLMKQMETVSNLVEDRELKAALKNCGIGTSATRAETINKLKNNKYVTIEKKKIELTKLGKNIVELVRKSNASFITSPQFTGEWERSLEQIKTGKAANDFQKFVIDFTTKFIEEIKEHTIDQDMSKVDCLCPRCGSSITTYKKMYRCSKKDCSFILWKTQYGKTISTTMLKDLLTKGETSLLTFKTKTGNRNYKAKFKLPNEFKDGKLIIERI